ncbi:MAG: mannose-6-phosphate isomerase, class I [Succinivibrio sp.]|nr:mannose-6-phosphate isomerase, class I [Succinivibrio sp.]
MLLLKGSVKHYAWGGYGYIPQFLGEIPDGSTPSAELWLGAHEAGPAVLTDGSTLDKWLSEDPQGRLGAQVTETFGPRLPYLMKVLDIREPLSIQVHPTLEQAKAGYARESAANTPVAQRSYKDDNHKPEIGLALTQVFLLQGFAPKAQALAQLGRFESLKSLAADYESLGLKEFVHRIFALKKEEINSLCAPLLERYERAYLKDELSRLDPLFWLLRAALVNREHNLSLDAGLIMVLIMNLRCLERGEVGFMSAGMPHAYLEGQVLELMANSDNVVRGGLTPKHVDVPELLAISNFERGVPQLIKPRVAADGAQLYEVPVRDFVLSEYQLKAGESLNLKSPSGGSIYLVFEGEGALQGQAQLLKRSSAFYQAPGEDGVLKAHTALRLFKAACAL